jgi:hypothetical protein
LFTQFEHLLAALLYRNINPKKRKKKIRKFFTGMHSARGHRESSGRSVALDHGERQVEHLLHVRPDVGRNVVRDEPVGSFVRNTEDAAPGNVVDVEPRGNLAFRLNE